MQDTFEPCDIDEQQNVTHHTSCNAILLMSTSTELNCTIYAQRTQTHYKEEAFISQRLRPTTIRTFKAKIQFIKLIYSITLNNQRIKNIIYLFIYFKFISLILELLMPSLQVFEVYKFIYVDYFDIINYILSNQILVIKY